MKYRLENKYPILITVSMILLTLCKIYFLYINVYSPEHTLAVLFWTTLLLAGIYLLTNFVIFRKLFSFQLLFHELFALIIFSDIVYFKYFNTLPSVAELKMVSEAAAVGESIKELIKPHYFILFADLPLFVAAGLGLGRKKIQPHGKIRVPAVAGLLLVVITIASVTLSGLNSFRTFDSFGLLQFHGVQAKEIFNLSKNRADGELVIKELEDVMKSYNVKPRYFGVAKDRNIIVVQVEALQKFVINREYEGQVLTPNLNKLLEKDTLYYDSYYNHIGRGGTSDAEFTTLNSLYPSTDAPAYEKYVENKLYALPMILRDRGYSTTAFHAYKPEFWNRNVVYPKIGFDTFLSGAELNNNEIIGMGLSDKSFFKQATEYMQNAKKPSFSFLITLSSHHPYGMPEEFKQIKLNDRDKDTLIGRYLQTINYTDAALGLFIEELKAAGLYENSIIAIYGDHHGVNSFDEKLNSQMSELLGHSYRADEMINVPLIMHIPNSNIQETNSIVGGQMDFLPTLLNLIGVDKGDIRFYGQDLNNAKSGLATTQLLLPKGSFIEDDKVYIMAANGNFEDGKAWNRITGEPIDLEDCRSGYERITKAIDECSYLLNNNIVYKP